MNKLKRFRAENNLLAKDLAAYLGVSKGYVSRMESDADPLPQNQLRKLLNNDRGWDTSALTNEDSIRSVSAVATDNGTAVASLGSINNRMSGRNELNEAVMKAQIDSLKKEVELLRNSLDEEKQRSERFLRLLENSMMK